MRSTWSPRSQPVPRQSQVRSGVAISALAIAAVAIGVILASLADFGDGDEAKALRRAAGPEVVHRAATRGPEVQKPPDALPLPPSRPVRAEAKRRDRRASVPVTAVAAAEPEWNGQGMPSREWMRWQLGTMVEQLHESGSVSPRAMEAAVDGALEVLAAKRRMKAHSDPVEIARSQDQVDRAMADLASNLGIEGLDLTYFE